MSDFFGPEGEDAVMALLYAPTDLGKDAPPRLERQKNTAIRNLLQVYDAKDAQSYAFVIRQVIAGVADSAELAAALGLPESTVQRWSQGASIPPLLTRAAVVQVLLDFVDNGPSRTTADRRELFRRVQIRLASELDNTSPCRLLNRRPQLVTGEAEGSSPN